MTKKAFWISYDLGIKGDFNSLYQWIDSHKGKECGNSVAYVTFSFQTDFIAELKKNLEDNIELKASDRIYIVYNDEGTEKTTGTFLFGNRKSAPWEGLAPSTTTPEDVL